MSQPQRSRKSVVPGLFSPFGDHEARRPALVPPPHDDEERKRRQEAPTLPPPPGAEDESIEEVAPPAAERSSGVRLKARARESKGTSYALLRGRELPAATVDEVVANRHRDPRYEEE